MQISQRTGLEDKNGKEGYHHNICKDEKGRIYEIVWSDNGWAKKYKDHIVDSEGIMRYLWRLTNFFCFDEIIGDIHENGEKTNVK